MKCPHCALEIHFHHDKEFAFKGASQDNESNDQKIDYGIKGGHCPACNKLIVLLQKGFFAEQPLLNMSYLNEAETIDIIFPKTTCRELPEEIPQKYKNDFIEAASVLKLSPKASAAISRRILQSILQDQYQIKEKGLSKQISTFVSNPNIPSYLSASIDAIRNIGNIAAHPLKDLHTGEIVEVEDGEAEWILETLESLFDFTFVQPIRLQKKKDILNTKLTAIGKPTIK